MDQAAQFLIKQGYIVVFLLVLCEQLGLPIPAVPILLAAGALAGIGKLNIVLVFSVAGSVVRRSSLVPAWPPPRG
jgi:membrane protein DedA with SNARE-associated domain